MKIGNIIKEYRSSHDLSMQEFADRSGLSKGYISMLERGTHPQNNKEIIPSIDTVQKIASAMGMTIDSLLASVDSDQQIEVAPPSLSEQTDALFIEKYGQAAFDHVMDYLRLDDRDQGKADGFIASLLDNDKYKRALYGEKAI